MPDKFNMTLAPFDRLSKSEQAQLRASLDVAYYREYDVILKAKQKCQHLHILIKGVVEESNQDDSEIFAHYGMEDLFDVRAQFDGVVKHKYTALEDTLSYLLPTFVFQKLYQTNANFAAYFDNDLAKRQALQHTAHQQQNLAEFILTKVKADIYQPATILSPKMSIQTATEQLKLHACDAALVHLDHNDPRTHQYAELPPYAIITRTDMLHALLLEQHPPSTAIQHIASFPVHSVQQGDYLFDAMLKMTRNKCKRLIVCAQGQQSKQAVGILDLTQVLSAFSTHSHVLTLSIARAQSIEELAASANRQRQLVDGLVRNGIRTRFVMELVAAINEQIIEKAFQLIVPATLHDHCCLLVLGSEGRGEQILKTDQDNALIIKDGLHWHQCQPIMDKLTHTLLQLGYPLCPGKIMVNNPDWVKTQLDWRKSLTQWAQDAKADQIMKLAIFSDAHAVAGNKQLLPSIKQHLHNILCQQSLVMMEFARPAVGFAVPLTLFGKVRHSKQGVDIKQGGIFPIVHGIRSLSVEHEVNVNNTFARIEQLQHKKVLEAQTASNLAEALKLFFKLRLQQQLQLHHNHNKLDIEQLSRAERDLLRHSLHIVKKFKQWLSYHYQIRD